MTVALTSGGKKLRIGERQQLGAGIAGMVRRQLPIASSDDLSLASGAWATSRRSARFAATRRCGRWSRPRSASAAARVGAARRHGLRRSPRLTGGRHDVAFAVAPSGSTVIETRRGLGRGAARRGRVRVQGFAVGAPAHPRSLRRCQALVLRCAAKPARRSTGCAPTCPCRGSCPSRRPWPRAMSAPLRRPKTSAPLPSDAQGACRDAGDAAVVSLAGRGALRCVDVGVAGLEPVADVAGDGWRLRAKKTTRLPAVPARDPVYRVDFFRSL